MPSNVGRSGMFAMVRPGYGIACLAIRGGIGRRDTAWHAGVTHCWGDHDVLGTRRRPMTLPTPEQLHSETDRRYSLWHPDGGGDADDAGDDGELDGVSHRPDEAAWLAIREQVLREWTDAVFNAFFPTAGDLAADDTVLIEYWIDIKLQISGEAGRWSWGSPPDPAL